MEGNMGTSSHVNEALYEAIRMLVTDNELDEKSDAYEIAMQVVDQGLDTLSQRQRNIYETRIEALLQRRSH
jgi:hypothetical protein